MSQPYPTTARAADRARVGAIDAEIRELQARIRVLQLEQASFQRRLDAYKYPVLTLPNEIASEIFIHCLPPYPDCPPLTGLDSPPSLTHICRTWREIALATPRLWRAISTSYVDSEAEQARVVQTWLERSGCYPLSLQLTVAEQAQNYTLVAMLSHRERWQHAELEIASSEGALIEGPFPLLESLSLSVDDFDYTHPTTSYGDFPQLRAVTLDDAHHGTWLPMSQLTSLTFDEVGPADYLPLLHGAANLVRLNLIDSDTSEPPQGGINLARLETLVMVDYPDAEISSQILDMFTLPALHTLHISGGLLGADPVSSLTLLISRSGCKLQQVVVAGSRKISKKKLRGAFPSIPNIVFERKYSWTRKSQFRNELNINPP